MTLQDDVNDQFAELRQKLEGWTEEKWAEEEAHAIAHNRRLRDAAVAKVLRQHEARLLGYGIPAKDIPTILGELNGQSARLTRPLQVVREFAGTILVLSGGRGIGKTFAAGYWLSQVAPGPHAFLQTTSARFVPALQLHRVSRYSEEQMGSLERARKLVIDDLSTEFVDEKGSLSSLLDGLVDARYRNLLPMIITTNLSAKDFKKRYGERIADRIRESGAFVPFDEPSMRGAK